MNRKFITVVLVVVLVCVPVRADDDVVTSCGAPCIIAIAALMVSGFIIWHLRKICLRLPPIEKPPPPPPAPITNNIPTNNFMSFLSGPVSSFSITLTFDTNCSRDITAWATNAAFLDQSGLPYRTLITGTVQSSTNLHEWDNALIVIGWVSESHCVMVWYDHNRVPLRTNVTTTSGNGTNQFPNINIVSPSEPVKFYKVVR